MTKTADAIRENHKSLKCQILSLRSAHVPIHRVLFVFSQIFFRTNDTHCNM